MGVNVKGKGWHNFEISEKIQKSLRAKDSFSELSFQALDFEETFIYK